MGGAFLLSCPFLLFPSMKARRTPVRAFKTHPMGISASPPYNALYPALMPFCAFSCTGILALGQQACALFIRSGGSLSCRKNGCFFPRQEAHSFRYRFLRCPERRRVHCRYTGYGNIPQRYLLFPCLIPCTAHCLAWSYLSGSRILPCRGRYLVCMLVIFSLHVGCRLFPVCKHFTFFLSFLPLAFR